MNERIKELAEQAGLKWKAQPPHYTNTNNTIDFPVSANRDLEKFAELIVKECMDIAKRTRNNFGSANPDVLEGGRGGAFCVYHNIKNTFGVEE